MAAPKPSGPRLVNGNEDAKGSPAPVSKEAPARSPRGPVFWLLAALAAMASFGFAMQTERVRLLQADNAVLEGNLFSARTALAAYTERFSVVRDTVAGLQDQIDALNALVSEDPLSSEAAPGESLPPAGVSSPGS